VARLEDTLLDKELVVFVEYNTCFLAC